MRLTYIFHSGFVLETEKSILIFDYWMDPGNVMESVLQSEIPLYVFSSHFHEDHYLGIYEMLGQKDIDYLYKQHPLGYYDSLLLHCTIFLVVSKIHYLLKQLHLLSLDNKKA